MRLHYSRLIKNRLIKVGVISATITATLLTACSTETPQTTGTTITTEAAPLDPYDTAPTNRAWQQEVVSTIVNVGRSRTDVDDDAIIAALTASYAETGWSIRFIRRNLLGWSYWAVTDAESFPDSDIEIRRALNIFYDRLLLLPRSGDSDDNIAELALQAQVTDTTKESGYYAVRPCDGDHRRSELCSPDQARATYLDALPKAEAAFHQL